MGAAEAVREDACDDGAHGQPLTMEDLRGDRHISIRDYWAELLARGGRSILDSVYGAETTDLA
jgi:hypothetical protein